MNDNRERLGSRLGFLLLSAGCAIGVGNVWKFPWMVGQFGGGAFVLVYLICLLLLGIPVMTAEFAIGRAAQKSPVKMYQSIEKKGQKWHIHGYMSLAGCTLLMMFYTTVAGWLLYYFCGFATGKGADLSFGTMISNPGINVGFMGIVVAICFIILSFNLQGGLESITKKMMLMLFILMGVLAVRSCLMAGAKEGLTFYLKPDLKQINGTVIVKAMNQSFFSLSLGMGSMAIFGSYIGKERSLGGESTNVVFLDTLVAILAGFIIFPSCFTYGIEVDAGPGLLFNTMATVFTNMSGGRIWGTLFFLFMVFASLSTVLAVCEAIVACIREMTGWERKKASLICGIGVFVLSLPCALGYNVFSGFVPFAEGSAFLDLWDFFVETCIQPLGSIIMIIFCSTKRYGWGWDNFLKEANTGKGMKFPTWIKYYFMYLLPAIIAFIYIYGFITFQWK